MNAADIPYSLLRSCQRQGYRQLRRLPSGEIAGISRLLYTTALFVGIDGTGYRLRYCYENDLHALEALKQWDGTGDPPGPWIKAKGRGIDGKQRDDIGPGAID